MTSLLSSKPILQLESSLLALFDRTFSKAFKLKTANFKKEIPNRIRQQFSSQTFAVQFDKLITELVRVSILHADAQMGKMQAAKVNPSYVLTEEAVRISKDLSKDVGDKIVRLLQDDAIYYEGPAKLARRIEDLYDGQRYRAMGFTQTFTADVATNTTVQRYRQWGVRYMEFDAELDDRTTDRCRMLDGSVFDLERESVDAFRPPTHPRCRSALRPVPITRQPSEDMIFENRDFSKAIDNPDEVFKKIGAFNDKYRISQFTLDEDIAARIMMEKGAWVGIEGPDITTIVDVANTPIRIAKNTISRLPKTHYEIMTELRNEGMDEFDSQVRFLQSVLKNRQWHNVKLTDAEVHEFKNIYLDYLTESKKYKDYAIRLHSLSDDDLINEYKALNAGTQRKAVIEWYSEADMTKLDSIVSEAMGMSTESSRLGSLAGLSADEREQATKSYHAIQEYLKRKYPSGRITVYRGVTGDTYTELVASGLDSTVDVTTYNISCWTTDANVAKGFTVSKDGGVVLKADIPIEKVYLHYDISDPLYDFEKEITVMGDEFSVAIDDIRYAKDTYTIREQIERQKEIDMIAKTPKKTKSVDINKSMMELDFDEMFG